MNLNNEIKDKIIEKTKNLNLKDGEETYIKIKLSRPACEKRHVRVKNKRYYEDQAARSRLRLAVEDELPMTFMLSNDDIVAKGPEQFYRLVEQIENCRVSQPSTRLCTIVHPLLCRLVVDLIREPCTNGLAMARRLLRRYADYSLDTLEACNGDISGSVDGAWKTHIEEVNAGKKEKHSRDQVKEQKLTLDDSTASPSRQLLNTLSNASLFDLQTNQSIQFFIMNKTRVLLESECLDKLIDLLMAKDMDIMALLVTQYIKLEVLNSGLGYNNPYNATRIRQRDVFSIWRQEQLKKIQLLPDIQTPLPHVKTYQLDNLPILTDAALASNGTLACACHDNAIRVFNGISSNLSESCNFNENRFSYFGEPLIFRGHSDSITRCSFTFDSQFILSSSIDSKVYLWDINNHDSVATYVGHNQPIWDLATSDTNCRFLTCGADTTAKLWDTEYIICLRVFVGHTSDVNCVCFAGPYKQLIASGGLDGVVFIWDIRKGTPVRLMLDTRNKDLGSITTNAPVLKVASSECGDYVFSVHENCDVKIWKIQTGVVVHRLQGFYGRCISLVISEKMHYVIVSSSDRLFIWRLNPTSDGFNPKRIEPVVRSYQMTIKHLNFSGHHLNCVGVSNTDIDDEIYEEHR